MESWYKWKQHWLLLKEKFAKNKEKEQKFYSRKINYQNKFKAEVQTKTKNNYFKKEAFDTH